MAKIGWISIHRKIQECDIWLIDEPFDRRSAWIDLLLLANHDDKAIIFDGHRITVKRGQYLTSVRKLSAKWHWGKDKTLKYLRLLEECEMITRNADSRRTLITIVNYSIYQSTNSEIADSNKDSKQTASRQSSATNNNDNNDNNENNKKRFVKPTVEEVRAYCQERNNTIDPQAFVDFYQSKGWKVGKDTMKDWKAAVRTWENRRKGENNSGRNRPDTKTDEAELDAFIERLANGTEEGELPFV